jgi:transcriptional regulator with XRE-family HTH domain
MKKKKIVGTQTTDVLAWLESILPDTPEMRAIEEEENAKFDLAIALSKAREASGHTQSSLANELGVNQSLVSKWEKIDHNHTLETLLALCRATGANLVMGLEINGQLVPVTEATKRCVLLSEKTQKHLEAQAEQSGLTPREVLMAQFVTTVVNPVMVEPSYQVEPRANNISIFKGDRVNPLGVKYGAT